MIFIIKMIIYIDESIRNNPIIDIQLQWTHFIVSHTSNLEMQQNDIKIVLDEDKCIE